MIYKYLQSDLEYPKELYQVNKGKSGKYIVENNRFLYFKNQMWILDSKELKKKFLNSEYNSKVAGHFGFDKTYELVYQNFF
jgi:uncharacterized membrane protein (UPF0182 family)